MNLDLLRDVPVQLICFAAYSVYLHFHNGVVISIENGFQFFEEGMAGDPPPFIEFPLTHSALMAIIEAKVLDVSIDAGGTLRLRFSSGHCLVVPKVPLYEAYSIDRVVENARTVPLADSIDD